MNQFNKKESKKPNPYTMAAQGFNDKDKEKKTKPDPEAVDPDAVNYRTYGAIEASNKQMRDDQERQERQEADPTNYYLFGRTCG